MLILLSAIVLTACQNPVLPVTEADYQVIPLPQEVALTEGSPFIISSGTPVFYPKGNELLRRNAEFLSGYARDVLGKKLKTASYKGEKDKGIILALDKDIRHEEGYEIVVTPEKVEIKGKTEVAVFYGIQTLRKSMPVKTEKTDIALPAAHIKDYPRFTYRGVMLDVCRHFFPVDFVKKYIDILALHNINYFHWHLTDDQGWRIEIKKYPKLTEIGSQRKETVVGLNSGEYDGQPYGGYYTQEEIKEVIAYAKERYITIVPEINFPGHMLAALTAYPELGCTGGPYNVATRWGVFKDVLCIGNEDAMRFLEDVLGEVTDLFPSEYIHVGGDEAPRNRWKVCSKCQERIRKEGIRSDGEHAAEDYLQSYCMQRMEKLLNAKGRRIIGWDEILEGKVAQNATVMSWRGMSGGIKAAQLHHDVIMAPTTHAYFDYYGTDNLEGEPLGIGGFVSIEKVYGMEPVPAELKEDEKKYIIGAQANLWTEYITTPGHVEYMVLPRMAALAEVQWTSPEKKNYQDFARRLMHQLDIYDKEGYRYARHIFDLKTETTSLYHKKGVEVSFSTIDDAPVYYTLDGSHPTTSSAVYKSPLLLTESADVKAVAIRPEGESRVSSTKISLSKTGMRHPAYLSAPVEKYTYGGKSVLTDGICGGSSYSSGQWLGFQGDVYISLDVAGQEVSKVTLSANVEVSSWIMAPIEIIVSKTPDNKAFTELARKQFPVETDLGKKEIVTYELTFPPVSTRYIHLAIVPPGELPKGHSGEGKPPYMFLDEIIVE